MNKILSAVGAAALGSAILAGGSALADDDDRYKRYTVLATGLTFCPAGDLAVFPATNVSRRGAWVKVSCVDGDGDEFGTLGGDDGPFKGRLGAGEAVILANGCVDTTGLDGELVRCTVSGRVDHIERIRGVLHICDGAPADGCELTEALLFSDGDDD